MIATGNENAARPDLRMLAILFLRMLLMVRKTFYHN